MKLSECCGVPPKTEWHELSGICSKCGEHTEYVEEAHALAGATRPRRSDPLDGGVGIGVMMHPYPDHNQPKFGLTLASVIIGVVVAAMLMWEVWRMTV